MYVISYVRKWLSVIEKGKRRAGKGN